MGLAVTSDVQRPPAALARLIERRVPGLWVAFADALEQVGRRVNATVTSWWRDERRNAQVGGDPHSQHLLGLAVDLTGDLPAIAAVARAAGFVVVLESDHVHVQVFAAGQAERAGLFSRPFRFAA